LAALGIGLAVTWWATATQAQREGATDQLIVSFTPNSEAGQQVAGIDLAAVSDPTGDRRLLEIARAWGERLGVPLRVEGLTSGRELLFAIDQEALAAVVAERLGQREGVIDAEVVTGRSGSGDAGGPRIAVAVAPDSAFAAAVAGGERVVVLRDPSGDRSGQVPIATTVEASGPANATLALDLEALVSAVAEHLQADPDVRYVQRNLRLRPYG
jgi:hypothetical protein